MEHEKKIEASAERVEDSAARRTILAANRTVFAAERTYAAWVRTALVALASGVGAKATLHGVVSEWLIIVAGTVLVLFQRFLLWRRRLARDRHRSRAAATGGPPTSSRLADRRKRAAWLGLAVGLVRDLVRANALRKAFEAVSGSTVRA